MWGISPKSGRVVKPDGGCLSVFSKPRRLMRMRNINHAMGLPFLSSSPLAGEGNAPIGKGKASVLWRGTVRTPVISLKLMLKRHMLREGYSYISHYSYMYMDQLFFSISYGSTSFLELLPRTA